MRHITSTTSPPDANSLKWYLKSVIMESKISDPQNPSFTPRASSVTLMPITVRHKYHRRHLGCLGVKTTITLFFSSEFVSGGLVLRRCILSHNSMLINSRWCYSWHIYVAVVDGGPTSYPHSLAHQYTKRSWRPLSQSYPQWPRTITIVCS